MHVLQIMGAIFLASGMMCGGAFALTLWAEGVL
jgi:hypothetical protein